MGIRYLIWFVALALIALGLMLIFARPEDVQGISVSDQLIALGASLVTAGILAITLDRVSAMAISHRVETKLNEGLGELKLRNFGIANIEDSTPYRQISRSIQKSDRLTIIQTWCPQLKRMLRAADKVIERGGKVDVFLLHPDSQSARRRSLDLDESEDYVPSKIKTDTGQVRSFLQLMKKKYGTKHKDLHEKISLYYYRCAPTCAIYRTNNLAWIALYWISAQSDDEVNIVLDASGATPAASRIDEQIEALLQNHETEKVDLEALHGA